jgi:hypothetical protein
MDDLLPIHGLHAWVFSCLSSNIWNWDNILSWLWWKNQWHNTTRKTEYLTPPRIRVTCCFVTTRRHSFVVWNVRFFGIIIVGKDILTTSLMQESMCKHYSWLAYLVEKPTRLEAHIVRQFWYCWRKILKVVGDGSCFIEIHRCVCIHLKLLIMLSKLMFASFFNMFFHSVKDGKQDWVDFECRFLVDVSWMPYVLVVIPGFSWYLDVVGTCV